EAWPLVFFFSSRRRHTRSKRDWSSDVCSSDLRSVSATRCRLCARGCAKRNIGSCRTLCGSWRHGLPTALLSVSDKTGLAAFAREIGRASCRERVEGAGGAGAGINKDVGGGVVV